MVSYVHRCFVQFQWVTFHMISYEQWMRTAWLLLHMSQKARNHSNLSKNSRNSAVSGSWLRLDAMQRCNWRICFHIGVQKIETARSNSLKYFTGQFTVVEEYGWMDFFHRTPSGCWISHQLGGRLLKEVSFRLSGEQVLHQVWHDMYCKILLHFSTTHVNISLMKQAASQQQQTLLCITGSRYAIPGAFGQTKQHPRGWIYFYISSFSLNLII